jgi:hypothetical protein
MLEAKPQEAWNHFYTKTTKNYHRMLGATHSPQQAVGKSRSPNPLPQGCTTSKNTSP